ncbi:MAG: SH3 domain-containing protein [Candidatus Omnitrophota bacterium]
MRLKSKIPFFTLVFCLFLFGISYAQLATLFEAEVKASNINVRSDSTVTSQLICTVDKRDTVEVVSQAYEWYKIRLPKSAPSFIKKELVVMLDNRAAKVVGNNVNVRLGPGDSSSILGEVRENEVINVLEEVEGWYKIEPVNNSFGWVHSRFVKPLDKKEAVLVKEDVTGPQKEFIVEGIIKAKAIRRIATHKLIVQDGSIFLLKGNKESMDALNDRKVRVSGKLVHLPNREYPLIEIAKMEALD